MKDLKKGGHRGKFRPTPRFAERRLEGAGYLAAFIGVLLVAVFFYAEFTDREPVRQGDEPVAAVPAEQEEGTLTELPEAYFQPEPGETAQEEEEESSGLIRGEIAPGDTAGAVLQQWLSPAAVSSLVEAAKDAWPLSRIRAGRPYAVWLDQGDLVRFEYEADDNNRLVIVREIEGSAIRWKASLEKIEYEIRLARVEGSIDSNLFETMSLLGENPVLAVRLADIFAWEINFIRDLQPGDSFRMLVEKRWRDGEFKGYGNIPVAEFVNKKKKFEAFRFKDSFGNNAFFTAAGESLKRAFLKAPLSFTRISSRFSSARLHPILHIVRAHPAVDYAAPTGTPVKAIGGGVVTFRGFGRGAGNYVVLKHSGGYESMYMHLSGFARNLKQGGRVRQGEVIGFVGSTGYATGPHLDFRMKKDGRFLNPEKVLSPRDEAVPKARLEAFRSECGRMRSLLNGDADLEEYASAQGQGGSAQ
ncbi:MAG: M23 family metallopeptidase [Desulfovibrio sp.]|jgi:murein DD-endopeptidase MepM/ murein hydrolase activator NlpD|nr:M23 family metallopeptidase [Desulfovibrio sp.]